MYRGYSISISVSEIQRLVGRNNAVPGSCNTNQQAVVKKNIYEIFKGIDDNGLDAKVIQDEWFPEIEADVFISHSHKDLNLAKTFAWWLHEQFGITSFIDSCVWRYADDLLKEVDDRYCKIYNCYNYKKRNYSTAHIHMMLMTALAKMIDKSECIMFLNTPNSNVGKGIKSKTLSPWIYGEIEISRLIEKKPPKRERMFSEDVHYMGVPMTYPLGLDHFYALSCNDLINWKKYNCDSPEDALDKLYEITSNNKKMTL